MYRLLNTPECIYLNLIGLNVGLYPSGSKPIGLTKSKRRSYLGPDPLYTVHVRLMSCSRSQYFRLMVFCSAFVENNQAVCKNAVQPTSKGFWALGADVIGSTPEVYITKYRCSRFNEYWLEDQMLWSGKTFPCTHGHKKQMIYRPTHL